MTCVLRVCVYIHVLVFSYSSVAFAGAIAVWSEKNRLHLSETSDKIILYFHVSQLHTHMHLHTHTHVVMHTHTHTHLLHSIICSVTHLLCSSITLCSLFLFKQAFLAPMQGFWNAIVYGWSRKEFRRAVKLQHRNRNVSNYESLNNSRVLPGEPQHT